MQELEARDVLLEYRLPGGGRLPVLDVDLLRVPAGAAVGITGPSGSGKTSLLYVLCGLERPDAGSVVWGGRDIAALPEGARDRWRRASVGLVFQDFGLLPGMTALQNVLLPGMLDHLRLPAELRDRARALLARVGLQDGGRRVERMSRGEMQRVAVARALLFRPAVVLADEPTASLDAVNGEKVGDLVREVCREHGSTLIVVSHDLRLLEKLGRVYTLRNGRLTGEVPACQ